MSNIKIEKSAGCKESIKLFNKIIFTNRAVSILTTEYKVNLEDLTAVELEKLLIEANEDKDIMVDGNYEDAVWTEDDMEAVCIVDDMDVFWKIEELKIYVTSDLHNGEYYIYGDFGDASVFLDCYVGLCECDDAEIADKTFNENLNNIEWFDEDNELKQAVDNILNQIENDIEGEDVILFRGRDWSASLEGEIEKLVDYNEADYEVMGYYSGEEIYRIKNKIYYLTDGSGTCNDEYYWELQELGPKGYEYFKMKPNVDNEFNQIENDIEGEDVILFRGSDWSASLEGEIEKLVDYNEADYEVMGYYSQEKIYRIKNKIYYLTDGSGTYNDKYYWELQELGPKGYEHFKMK